MICTYCGNPIPDDASFVTIQNYLTREMPELHFYAHVECAVLRAVNDVLEFNFTSIEEVAQRMAALDWDASVYRGQKRRAAERREARKFNTYGVSS